MGALRKSIAGAGVEYLIDAEDYARLPGEVYVNNDPVGYLRIRSNAHGDPLLHRWILGLPNRDPRLGDHVNRDHLDNRRSNLRIVTPTESNHNRRAWNKAGLPKGVSRLPSGRYQARLKHEGVAYNLGTYATPYEASAVREAKLKNLRGGG